VRSVTYCLPALISQRLIASGAAVVSLFLPPPRAHAEHAVLGMENDFALRRHVIGNLQRRADAEVDVPTFGNIAGDAHGHLIA
jgi:hypothetical protein